MKNFDELLKNALEYTVDDISGKILDNVKNGESLTYEINNTLDDILYDRVYEISDQFVPVYDSDILSLAASDLRRVSEAYDRALGEQGPEIVNNGDRNFNGVLSIGVYYLIEQYLVDNMSEIRELIRNKTMEDLKSGFTEEQLNDNDFILNEIRESNYAWPFIVAGENVRDNPIVLLEAANIDDWVCEYASDRLVNLCQNNEPIKALESEILNNQLSKDLSSSTSKRNAHKV